MARLSVDYTYTGNIEIRVDEYTDENMFLEKFENIKIGDIIDLPVKLLDIVDTTITCEVIRIFDTLSKYRSADEITDAPRRNLSIVFKPVKD